MALTFSDIRKAAESIGVEPCAVKAVVEVESGGNGFLMDGRPKVLFEGHIFWRELKKRNMRADLLAKRYPDILYPSWTKAHYRDGSGEWDRLNEAINIHTEAALCSASWGMFQIMGFNHAACGFDSVQDFAAAQKESEGRQLESFCAFMRSEGLTLFLLGKDWAGFARRYNGPGYAANQYDVKLRKAYERCKAGA
jgi:hypothetical protein